LSQLTGSKNPLAGTLAYMAPELISQLKDKSTEEPNLVLCDVYSYGIMLNEVVTHSKPFEGLTLENCYERIVINKEKPVFKMPEKEERKEERKEEKENTPQNLSVHLEKLINSCCHSDPSQRVPFYKMLEKDGLLVKIKKDLLDKIHAKKLRQRLEKRKVDPIEFSTFWTNFIKVFGSGAEKGNMFMKILMNITEHNTKISMDTVLRICDWLNGVDAAWISGGYLKSFFVRYYIGEKTKQDVLDDQSLHEGVPKVTKYMAILHWERNEKTFVVTTKCLIPDKGEKQTSFHHTLKTKEINILDKEALKAIDIQRYKGTDKLYWVTSTLFNRLNKYKAGNQVYTTAGGSTASIYVY